MKYSMLALFAFLLLGLTSCNKDSDECVLDIKPLENEVDDNNDKKGDGIYSINDSDCYTFVFPIGFVMPDGSSITLADNEDNSIKDWYEDNEVDTKPTLQYPVQLIWGDKRLTINSDEGLERLKKACEEEKGDEYEQDDDIENDKYGWKGDDCIELLFPISYLMPDGTTISINDDKDTSLNDWYETNEVDAKPELVYPIGIMYNDEVYRVSSEEELDRFKSACREEYYGEHDDCIELLFPINYLMPDSTTITLVDKNDLAVREWYQNNGSEDHPELQYPVDIIFDDQTFIVNSENEMSRFKEACKNDDHEEYDCPELRLDIGDDCRIDENTNGTINTDCECE